MSILFGVETGIGFFNTYFVYVRLRFDFNFLFVEISKTRFIIREYLNNIL